MGAPSRKRSGRKGKFKLKRPEIAKKDHHKLELLLNEYEDSEERGENKLLSREAACILYKIAVSAMIKNGIPVPKRCWKYISLSENIPAAQAPANV